MQQRKLHLYKQYSYLVSTCNKSQPWVSLYCPLGETGILREQLLPVTEDILHFKVFPNEVKAPVFIKTRHKVLGHAVLACGTENNAATDLELEGLTQYRQRGKLDRVTFLQWHVQSGHSLLQIPAIL